MPVYEYRRPDGTTFEILQKFSDDTLTHDPETGVPVFKVLSAPAIHFKGKGFHNTDYGTKKRPVGGGAEGSESGNGSDGGKADGGSADSGSGGKDGATESKSTSGDSSSNGSSSGSSADGGGSSSGTPTAAPAASAGSSKD